MLQINSSSRLNDLIKALNGYLENGTTSIFMRVIFRYPDLKLNVILGTDQKNISANCLIFTYTKFWNSKI